MRASVTGQTEISRVGYIKGAMRDIVFIQMGTVIGSQRHSDA